MLPCILKSVRDSQPSDLQSSCLSCYHSLSASHIHSSLLSERYSMYKLCKYSEDPMSRVKLCYHVCCPPMQDAINGTSNQARKDSCNAIKYLNGIFSSHSPPSLGACKALCQSACHGIYMHVFCLCLLATSSSMHWLANLDLRLWTLQLF